MSNQMLPNEDHEVVGSEFCSGYVDSSGKWSSGFFCPKSEAPDAVFCCGTSTFKYCCPTRDEPFAFISEYIASLTLMLGIACGAALVIVIVVVLSCFFCSCCCVYKRRRNNGPVYQMHSASSAASGVANMYSFSNQNSSATTPVDPINPQQLVDMGYETTPADGPRAPRKGQSFATEPHKRHHHHGHHHGHHHRNHSHHRHHKRHHSDDVLIEESTDADMTPCKDPNEISLEEHEDKDSINKDSKTSPKMNGIPAMAAEETQSHVTVISSPTNDETLYWSTKF